MEVRRTCRKCGSDYPARAGRIHCDGCYYDLNPDRKRYRDMRLRRLRRKQKKLHWAKWWFDMKSPKGGPGWVERNLREAERILAKELASPYWMDEEVPEYEARNERPGREKRDPDEV